MSRTDIRTNDILTAWAPVGAKNKITEPGNQAENPETQQTNANDMNELTNNECFSVEQLSHYIKVVFDFLCALTD